MPDYTSSSRPSSRVPPSIQTLAALCRAHDADGLAAVESYLAVRPGAPANLPLARMLAAYTDQRGWRQRAMTRYQALLEAAIAPADLATLHYDLVEHAHRWSDRAAMARHLDAAEQAHAALDDWALTARGLRLRALLHSDQLQPTIGRAKAQAALDLATTHDDWPAQAAALVILSYALVHLGKYAEAAACTGRAIHADPAVTGDKWYAIAVSDYGYALRRLEGDAAALPYYEQALALQSLRRDPIEVRTASANVAEAYRQLGRLDEAETILRHAIGLLETIDAADQAGLLFNGLGNVQARRGDHIAAVAWYQRALRCARQFKQFAQEITACANLGASCYHLGDLPEAAAWWIVSGVRAFWSGRQQELSRRVLRLRKALVDATPDQKTAAYQRALVLASELGWRPSDVRALGRLVGLLPEVDERAASESCDPDLSEQPLMIEDQTR